MSFVDKTPKWVQVSAIIVLSLMLVMANIGVNKWKEHDCVSSGGRYIKNVSDATLSTCRQE